MESLMGLNIGATGACLESKRPSTEETANVAAHPEDTNGATREQLRTDLEIGEMP
jgi:hypothetical protein